MSRAPAPRVCAAARCREAVKPGMLMCREHWFALPKGLRSTIGHSWRARRMRDYAASVEAAVNFIAEQENPFQEVFSETRFLPLRGSDRVASLPRLCVPENGGVAR